MNFETFYRTAMKVIYIYNIYILHLTKFMGNYGAANPPNNLP